MTTEAQADLILASKDSLDTFEKLRADLASVDAELHAQRIAVIDTHVDGLHLAIRSAEGWS